MLSKNESSKSGMLAIKSRRDISAADTSAGAGSRTSGWQRAVDSDLWLGTEDGSGLGSVGAVSGFSGTGDEDRN